MVILLSDVALHSPVYGKGIFPLTFVSVMLKSNWDLGRLIVEVYRSHTKLDTRTHKYTNGTTPLYEWSACRRGHHLHNAQETTIRAFNANRTRNPSNEAVAFICSSRDGQRARLFPSYKKVKESRNRPDVAQRVPGGLDSQISMTFGTWRWWGCKPPAPAAFTPRKYSWYSFSPGAESTPSAMVRSEGNMSLKNPVTPPGIDPGTVRLVSQCLNHYATPGPCFPLISCYNSNNTTIAWLVSGPCDWATFIRLKYAAMCHIEETEGTEEF